MKRSLPDPPRPSSACVAPVRTAPPGDPHHTLPELRRWFEEEGFTDLVELRPAKAGRLYEWAYDRDLIIGSGVNVAGVRRA